MRGDKNMPVVYLTLPFATAGKNTKTEPTDDVELAAIVCVSEIELARSGAQNVKAAFISKLYYPIWAVSSGKGCFLLDGLRLVTGDIPVLSPQDSEALIDDLGETRKTRINFLEL